LILMSLVDLDGDTSTLRSLIDSHFNDAEGFIDGIVSHSTFTIPGDYMPYIELLPVDTSAETLVQTANDCAFFKNIHVVRTTGDGDCLLHAVSLSMWGVEDKHQLLRGLLSLVLSSTNPSSKLLILWCIEEIKRDIDLVIST
jgi:hypothetical protein